jgi:hypothetical protein
MAGKNFACLGYKVDSYNNKTAVVMSLFKCKTKNPIAVVLARN